MRIPRRDFLKAGLGWAVAATPYLGSSPETGHLLGPGGPGEGSRWLRSAVAGSAQAERGELLGTVPFVGEADTYLNRPFGEGLAGGLLFDLSTLDRDRLITPTPHFFIRTRYPDLLDPSRPWSIVVRGLVGSRLELPAERMVADSRHLGTHLIECAGNVRRGHFGLVSTARWSGLRLSELLEQVEVTPAATRLLVVGADDHSRVPPGAVRGASWVFGLEDIESTGAFLATGMNGEPLPRDHGFPVRLVVPGWYGCTCIKWVEELVLVDDRARATDHMREYAGRTHQSGVPELARDFLPASIDPAAVPIRVEKRRSGGELGYRVVGLRWGGGGTTAPLQIRFAPTMDYVPVSPYDPVSVEDPAGSTAWTLWSHSWRPSRPGLYRIRLRIADPGVRTPRLDAGFYERRVRIDDV